MLCSVHFYILAIRVLRVKLTIMYSSRPLIIDQFRTLNFQADETMSMFNNWNFESPRQFWNLFPHTPDNSFLGFVVQTRPLNTTAPVKLNQAVIYGKEAWYRHGNEELLNTVGEFIELHSTFKVSIIFA